MERIPEWESAQKVDPGEENYPVTPAGTQTWGLSIISVTLTTELSPLPSECTCVHSCVHTHMHECVCIYMCVCVCVCVCTCIPVGVCMCNVGLASLLSCNLNCWCSWNHCCFLLAVSQHVCSLYLNFVQHAKLCFYVWLRSPCFIHDINYYYFTPHPRTKRKRERSVIIIILRQVYLLQMFLDTSKRTNHHQSNIFRWSIQIPDWSIQIHFIFLRAL